MTLEAKDFRLLSLVIVATQLTLAVAAVLSSISDPLSDLACLGGIFGSLANVVLCAAASLWAMISAIRSYRAKSRRPELKYLLLVAGSSAVAFLIGVNAALHCTV